MAVAPGSVGSFIMHRFSCEGQKLPPTNDRGRSALDDRDNLPDSSHQFSVERLTNPLY
jgi:hypothetical protein